jgi:hypothetical protein
MQYDQHLGSNHVMARINALLQSHCPSTPWLESHHAWCRIMTLHHGSYESNHAPSRIKFCLASRFVSHHRSLPYEHPPSSAPTRPRTAAPCTCTRIGCRDRRRSLPVHIRPAQLSKIPAQHRHGHYPPPPLLRLICCSPPESPVSPTASSLVALSRSVDGHRASSHLALASRHGQSSTTTLTRTNHTFITSMASAAHRGGRLATAAAAGQHARRRNDTGGKTGRTCPTNQRTWVQLRPRHAHLHTHTQLPSWILGCRPPLLAEA